MFAFRRSNVTVAVATALLALGLSLPASAQQSPPAAQPTGEALQANAAEIPTTRVRSAVRKRVAKPASVRRYAAWPYWLMRPPVQRVAYRPSVQQVVAAQWPILFVGVGF
jgi:hypothetical protein